MTGLLDAALADISIECRREIAAELRQHGQVPVGLVRQCVESHGIEPQQLMIRLLPVAAEYARAPISRFYVGAVAMGMTSQEGEADLGALYLGANLEFPGHPLNSSVHAEQSAANNAWLNGEAGIQAIAVSAAPCGYCRQFLNELPGADRLSILLKTNSDAGDGCFIEHLLPQLLPHAFGPKDLGVESLLMADAGHQLSADVLSSLAAAALDAASRSYAPYSSNRSGVALRTKSGTVVTGRCAENAAFNPSLLPLQSALAQLSMILPPQTPFEIEQAVVVDVPSKVSYRWASEALLASIAPGVELQYVTASGD